MYVSPWGAVSVIFVLAMFGFFVAFVAVVSGEWPPVAPPGEQVRWGTLYFELTLCFLAVLAPPVGLIIYKVAAMVKRRREAERAADMVQRARLVWQDLYYCYRDDVVFLESNSNVSAHADNMNDLLYRI